MSKRAKKITVKLDRIKGLHGRPLDVLRIGKRTVGEIKAVDHRLLARSNRGKVFHVTNLDEGLRYLLSEYHLHAK